MKKLGLLVLVLVLLCQCALADWTCTECGSSWQDDRHYCDECGFDAPVHGLSVSLAGMDFLLVSWYGPSVPVTVYVSPAGQGAWRTVAKGVTDNECQIDDLESGKDYDVMIRLPAPSKEQLVVTGHTVAMAAPTPKPTAVPTPTPTATPTPEPTAALNWVQGTEQTIGDYTCLLDNGTVKITKYHGNGLNLVIPATLGGYPVTSIGDSAFSWSETLTSVTIPDGVTSIGSDAFYDCEKLTSVTIPASVTSIGDNNPFAWCESLRTVNVSKANPVFSVVNSALINYVKKKLIWYPITNTSKKYDIPQGIITIGNEAFFNCRNLTSITIPDSVLKIGDSAFNDCSGLMGITIPEGVTSIGGFAFYGCTGLTAVTIPGSVTSIGDNPFAGCSSIHTIKVNTANPVFAVIDGALVNYVEKKLICVPKAKTGKAYAIPRGIISIGANAFEDCRNLTSVTIPDTVTSIGYASFIICENLTSVTIPSSVTGIDYFAFAGCTSLTSLTIPNSVTYIGDWCFYLCDGLTLSVKSGSYAQQYAINNGINYIAK